MSSAGISHITQNQNIQSLKHLIFETPIIKIGAHIQSRTGDLFITNEVLYRLSYASKLKLHPELLKTNQTWSG
jgi:hypothetical protein